MPTKKRGTGLKRASASIKFQAVPFEDENFKKWLRKHKKSCRFFKHPGLAGAIGGRLTYSFTPTGLGTVVCVRCLCGAEENLTDFDSW